MDIYRYIFVLLYTVYHSGRYLYISISVLPNKFKLGPFITKTLFIIKKL